MLFSGRKVKRVENNVYLYKEIIVSKYFCYQTCVMMSDLQTKVICKGPLGTCWLHRCCSCYIQRVMTVRKVQGFLDVPASWREYLIDNQDVVQLYVLPRFSSPIHLCHWCSVATPSPVGKVRCSVIHLSPLVVDPSSWSLPSYLDLTLPFRALSQANASVDA